MSLQANESYFEMAARFSDEQFGSPELWEALAAKNEPPSWDYRFRGGEVHPYYGWIDGEFRNGELPCPECGQPLYWFYGQIDQDRMGNDIHGEGEICHECGYDNIKEID